MNTIIPSVKVESIKYDTIKKEMYDKVIKLFDTNDFEIELMRYDYSEFTISINKLQINVSVTTQKTDKIEQVTRLKYKDIHKAKSFKIKYGRFPLYFGLKGFEPEKNNTDDYKLSNSDIYNLSGPVFTLKNRKLTFSQMINNKNIVSLMENNYSSNFKTFKDEIINYAANIVGRKIYRNYNAFKNLSKLTYEANKDLIDDKYNEFANLNYEQYF